MGQATNGSFMKKVIMNKDFWISLLMIGFGTLLFSQIRSAEQIHTVFPKIVSGSMVGMGLLMLLSSLRAKAPDSVKGLKFAPIEIVFIAILIAIVNLIEVIGFYTSALIFVVTLLLLLFRNRSVKVVAKSVMFSVILLIVVYSVFTLALKINLPKGLFI